MTALMAAAHEGHLMVVRELLAAKVDVHVRTDHGATALLLVSERGHQKVVQALLEARR